MLEEKIAREERDEKKVEGQVFLGMKMVVGLFRSFNIEDKSNKRAQRLKVWVIRSPSAYLRRLRN